MLKVDEEIQGVGDVVLVSASRLPDYQLGVVSNEATEHSQPNPDLDLYKIMIGSMSRTQFKKKIYLEEERGLEKNIKKCDAEDGVESISERFTKM